jgi:hypothetical protein
MIACVLLLVVMLLGRHVVHEFARQRTALLERQAELILLSARDWSHAHDEELRAAGRVQLPLDDLLPPLATGQLVLRRGDSNEHPPLIECRLRITQGRRSAARHAYWPARFADPEG